MSVLMAEDLVLEFVGPHNGAGCCPDRGRLCWLRSGFLLDSAKDGLSGRVRAAHGVVTSAASANSTAVVTVS